MNSYVKSYPGREVTEVYYVETLRRVQGFDTGNEGYLWCPEVGVSAAVGIHLFHTFLEAQHRRIENLTAESHRVQRDLIAAREARPESGS